MTIFGLIHNIFDGLRIPPIVAQVHLYSLREKDFDTKHSPDSRLTRLRLQQWLGKVAICNTSVTLGQLPRYASTVVQYSQDLMTGELLLLPPSESDRLCSALHASGVSTQEWRFASTPATPIGSSTCSLSHPLRCAQPRLSHSPTVLRRMRCRCFSLRQLILRAGTQSYGVGPALTCVL